MTTNPSMPLGTDRFKTGSSQFDGEHPDARNRCLAGMNLCEDRMLSESRRKFDRDSSKEDAMMLALMPLTGLFAPCDTSKPSRSLCHEVPDPEHAFLPGVAEIDHLHIARHRAHDVVPGRIFLTHPAHPA